MTGGTSRTPPASILTVAPLLLALALHAAALTADVPVIPVQVERVEVDVRVVDREGQPLAGLTAADFNVEIDGRPARVESAAYLAEEAGRAPAVAHSGRTLVFLIHLETGRAGLPGLLVALREAGRLADGLASDDRAAVLLFDTRLHLKLDFTSEREPLRRMLTKEVLRSPDLPWQPPGEGGGLAGLLDDASAARAGSPAGALEVLADALRRLPGAKSLLFFSPGFGETAFQSPQWGATPGVGGASAGPGDGAAAVRDLAADRAPLLPSPEARRRLSGQAGTELTRAILGLNAARASVVSFDVAPTAGRSQHQGTLEALADDTGGLYAKTHTFPAAAVQAARRVLSGRYVLSCEKPDLPLGRHAITVRLTSRRGVAVLARRTFSDR